MPVTRTKLDDGDVREALQARGYGFHICRGYPICLNVRSGEVRGNGDPVWRQLIPITFPKYNRILEYCETVSEAANQVELLSHGKLTDPNLPAEHGGVAQSIDSEAIDRIASARAEHAVAKSLSAFQHEMATARAERDAAIKKAEQLEVNNRSITGKVEALLAKFEAEKKAKKGRPVGSKNKAKPPAEPPTPPPVAAQEPPAVEGVPL